MKWQDKKDSNLLVPELPKALDIEARIIGTLLMSTQWLHELNGIISPETFYEEKHRIIYSKLLEWDAKGWLLDLTFVTQKLHDEGFRPSEDVSKDAGRITFSAYELMQMCDKPYWTANEMLQSALVLAEKHMRREAFKLARELESACMDESEFILDQLAGHSKKMAAIASSVDKRADYLPKKWVKKAMERIERGMSLEGISGIATGIQKLDKLLGGLQKQNVITIGARPRIGKSAVALFMAYMIAMSGVPVVYFTMEMTAEELAFRIFSIMTDIPYSDIQRGNIDPKQFALLNTIIAKVASIPLYIDDSGSLTTDKLRSKVFKYQRDHQIQVVLIDYLQQMRFLGKENMAEKLSSAMQDMKAQAKLFDLPYVILSQVDRTTEKGGVARHPTLADLKGSGGIEESSDVIICLHRPDEFEDNPMDAHGKSLVGVMEMYIEKNKQGTTGVIRLPFTKELNRFEMDSDERPDDPFAGIRPQNYY